MKKLVIIFLIVVGCVNRSFAQPAEVLKSDGISAETQEQYEVAAKNFAAAAKAFKAQNVIDTVSIYHAGVNYARIDEHAKAIPYLEEAIQLNYNVGRASRLLSDAYYHQKEMDKAESVLLSGKDACPQDEFEFDKKLAYLYFNSGQYEKAATTFQKVNEASPGNKNYLYLYGFSLERLKKYKEAISVFEQVEQQFPRYKKAIKMLGITLFEQADALNSETVKSYETNKGAKLEDYISTKRKLENIDQIYEKARLKLEESLDNYPNDKQIVNALYVIYKKQKKEDKANQMKNKL